MVVKITGVQPLVSLLHRYAPGDGRGEPSRKLRGPARAPEPPPPAAVPRLVPRMNSEKLPSWKAEGGSRRRPRSRGSYTRCSPTRCSPAEYMSTSRRAGPPALLPLRSQWTTRWRSCSLSWVHTMRGLWQRSTARAPAAQLTVDSDTTDLSEVAGPDGPGGKGESPARDETPEDSTGWG